MNSNALYSSIAKSYDTILGLSGYNLAVKYFVRRLPLDRSRAIKVLDAGCGTGIYSLEMLRRFPNATVTAFDLNEEMVSAFREKLAKNKDASRRVRILTTDINKPIAEPGEKFDLVITAGVLEYVDLEKAVRNLAAQLVRGGYFLNVSVKDNLFGKLVSNLYKLELYSSDRKVKAFTESGFALIKVMQFPPTREAYLFKMAA